MGESASGQLVPRLVHAPSSHMYCLPPWQLAEPLAYETPPN
jgi:hypothetical protein